MCFNLGSKSQALQSGSDVYIRFNLCVYITSCMCLYWHDFHLRGGGGKGGKETKQNTALL